MILWHATPRILIHSFLRDKLLKAQVLGPQALKYAIRQPVFFHRLWEYNRVAFRFQEKCSQAYKVNFSEGK